MVSSSSGVPAAHACGREAVGNATGTDVIEPGSRRTPRAGGARSMGPRERIAAGDRARRLVVAVAGEAGGDQRVLVGPDGAGVVAERVVAGLARAEGPHAPAGVELLVEQPLGGRGRLDARPGVRTTAGGRCWRSGCRPGACRRRAPARGSRARASRSRGESVARRSRGVALQALGERLDRPRPRGRGGRARRRAS